MNIKAYSDQSEYQKAFEMYLAPKSIQEAREAINGQYKVMEVTPAELFGISIPPFNPELNKINNIWEFWDRCLADMSKIGRLG